MYSKSSTRAGFLIESSPCNLGSAVSVFLLTTIALSIDFICAPRFINSKLVDTSAFFLLLLTHRAAEIRAAVRQVVALRLWRIATFALLHAAVIAATWRMSRLGIITTREALLPVTIAAAKYVVILPTLVLLSPGAWTRLARLYRPELIAALVALVTLPSRMWVISWPWYSSVLAHAIFLLSAPFVSGLRYIEATFPTLSGPTLDTTITLACGGMLIVQLFQLLFGILVIVDWSELNCLRTFLGYLAGIGVLLLANVLRIALLVITGNRISADLVVSEHLPASWLVIAVALIAYIVVVYPWMLNEKHRARYHSDSVQDKIITIDPITFNP